MTEERVYVCTLCPLSLSLLLTCIFLSCQENTDLLSLTLAHTARKTRGKFTTGGMNILGVLTSRGGNNVSDEEGVSERKRFKKRQRERERVRVRPHLANAGREKERNVSRKDGDRTCVNQRKERARGREKERRREMFFGDRR